MYKFYTLTQPQGFLIPEDFVTQTNCSFALHIWRILGGLVYFCCELLFQKLLTMRRSLLSKGLSTFRSLQLLPKQQPSEICRAASSSITLAKVRYGCSLIRVRTPCSFLTRIRLLIRSNMHGRSHRERLLFRAGNLGAPFWKTTCSEQLSRFRQPQTPAKRMPPAQRSPPVQRMAL